MKRNSDAKKENEEKKDTQAEDFSSTTKQQRQREF